MSRRKQAVPARITEFAGEAKGEEEISSIADGQIAEDTQKVRMDHSSRVTRTNGIGSQQTMTCTNSKVKGSGLLSLREGGRPGLRRTQRKNAAQRYKLGKIAAAESNKMIGAELRSERRRSTEGVAKGKLAGDKKSKGSIKAAVDNSSKIEIQDDSPEPEKEFPSLNGSCEHQEDDLSKPTIVQVKSDPGCNHHPPKRLLADSDPQPLNLVTGTPDSSDCQNPKETEDDQVNVPQDEDSNSSACSIASHEHLTADLTRDPGAPASAEEVQDESSASQSDISNEERTPSSTTDTNMVLVIAENGNSSSGKDPKKCPDASNSDDAGSYCPWKNNAFKRRRPMEEGNTSLTCPVCFEDFKSKHHLTLHFRDHKTTTSDGTMHSCKLCGKKLSSTSSLDRHMLIHSGERPHRCPICPMTFTTNGNMRRHVRTHDKGGSSGINNDGGYLRESSFSKPRKRIPSKRVIDSEDGESDIISKRPSLEITDTPPKLKAKEEELTCPICSKTFLCHIGLQTHMELHPNIVMKCSQCEATFRNHRGLRMHVLMSHKKSSSPSKLAPSNSEVPLGFQDLGYVADISCDKFPLIAQEWCEQNVRRCNSVVHRFICQTCSKAFPCASALDLHKTKNHSLQADAKESNLTDENDVIQTGEENHLSSEDEQARENKNRCYIQLRKAFPTQEQFMAKLFLRPNLSPSPKISPNHKPDLVTSSRSKASSLQISDEVQADTDFADVGKILTLTTSASSNPLLMLKHLGRGGKHSPGKATAPSLASTSPTKGKGAGLSELKPPVAHSHFPGQHKAAVAEPKSGDPATEMHVPTEFARDECRIEQATTACEETSSDPGVDSELTDSGKASDEDKDNRKLSKYICKYCQESFAQYSTLKIHLRTHMGLTPFKCLLCDYSSADKSTLVRHMRTHSGERPYSCKLCDFPFTTKANCERHIKKRHGKESKLDIEMSIVHNSAGSAAGESSNGKFRSPDTFCKFCNREFRFFRDLQNHLKVHQRTPRKPFFCLKCQTGFSSKNNCSRHVIKCHPEITKEDVPNYMMVRYTEVPDIAQVMANSFASNGEQLSPIDFSKKSALAAIDCDLSDQSWLSAYTLPNLANLDTPIDLSLPKDKCSNSFLPPVESSLGRLRFKRVYHKFYSKAIDALVCPHCSQSYTRGSLFKEHIRSHTTERPHRCYYCKAAFTVRDSLDKHIERRHSEESKSESPAQSFIPKVATPMQFKLMSRSSQGLRVRISVEAATEATDDLLDQPDPETKVTYCLQSPGSSFGSDASGELASVSKILAASSNNFQVCFPPAGVHVKQEVESEGEVIDGKKPSPGEDFPEAEKMRDHPTTSNWTEPGTPEIDMAGEYDLVIDESLVSTSDTGEGVEPNKTKERDRSNLPTKETCPYCHRKFPWISSLRRHILTHTGLKPFQCPQCNSSFSTKSNCERHIVRRHCLNVSPGDKVPENPFTCLEGCPDAAYSTKLKLMKHYEVQHASIPFPDCYKNEVKKLPAHIIRNALAKRANKLGSSRSFGSSEFRSRVGMSGVTLKLTRHKQLLKRRHSSIDEKPLALVKTSRSVSADDSRSTEIHLKKLYPMSVRGKPFPIVFKKKKTRPTSSMTNSIAITSTAVDQADNANGTPDQSTGNSKDLPTTRSLKYISGGAGTKPTSIKSKSKRKHAHHSCSQCCKRFKSATTLKRHYRVHTLEHPFRCAECSASFTTKFNCQRHMLKLHGKSKEETQSIIEKQRAEVMASAQQNGAASDQKPGFFKGDHTIIPNAADVPAGDVSAEDVLGETSGKCVVKDQEDDDNEENACCENVNNKNDDLDELEEFGDDVLGGLEDTDLPDSSLNKANDDSMDFTANWHQKSPATKVYGLTKKQESHVGTTMGLSRDVFVSGQTEDSDMIQNLLGIQDSSVLDQMLDSADSAAKLLGME